MSSSLFIRLQGSDQAEFRQEAFTRLQTLRKMLVWIVRPLD